MKYDTFYPGIEQGELPQSKNYVPPTWDELFMRDVYSISYKSKDPRSKLGAVLVDWSSKNPFTRGYNDFARGVEDKTKPERWERPEKYDWVVHAEANCILNCGREGYRAKGSVMFTQGIPVLNVLMLLSKVESWRLLSINNGKNTNEDSIGKNGILLRLKVNRSSKREASQFACLIASWGS